MNFTPSCFKPISITIKHCRWTISTPSWYFYWVQTANAWDWFTLNVRTYLIGCSWSVLVIQIIILNEILCVSDYRLIGPFSFESIHRFLYNGSSILNILYQWHRACLTMAPFWIQIISKFYAQLSCFFVSAVFTNRPILAISFRITSLRMNQSVDCSQTQPSKIYVNKPHESPGFDDHNKWNATQSCVYLIGRKYICCQWYYPNYNACWGLS